MKLLFLLACLPIAALADGSISTITGGSPMGMPVPTDLSDPSTVAPAADMRRDPVQSVTQDDYCVKAKGGEVPGISFRFFDRDWRFKEWEEARANVVQACGYWNDHMQDAGAILTLSKWRERFAELSLRARDEMIDATIRRLGPARSQGDTGTCYAQAVADVATYHLNKRVSAVSVAVRYAQNLGWLRIITTGALSNGGPEDVALRSATRGSLCPEDQAGDKLTYYQVTFDKLQKTYRTRADATPDALPALKGFVHALEPGLSADDFVQHLQANQSLEQAMGAWQDRQCNIRLSLPGTVVTRGLFTSKEIEWILDAKEPVLVGIDSKVLEGSIPWIKVTDHVGVVVAEITIDGKRQFLFRNSWGPHCGSYGRDIPGRCRAGHIWLNENEIVRAVQRVTYVRAKK